MRREGLRNAVRPLLPAPRRAERPTRRSREICARIVETFEPSGTGTRHTIHYEVKPGGLLGRPPALLVCRLMRLQLAPAERGHHRAPSVPDLLIAATAELPELTVLHMDKDFELIAELTDQRLERLEVL